MVNISKEIKDKQRILFVGNNADELISLTAKILTAMGKPHDKATQEDTSLTEAPLILMDFMPEDISHHILVVGEVAENALGTLKKVADKSPKAGSIIYDKSVKPVAKICEEDRFDVQQIAYKSKGASNKNKLIMQALFTRLRVPESEIDSAIA